MSRWEEQFKDHEIHATVEWLNDCASMKFNDLDDNEVSKITLDSIRAFDDFLHIVESGVGRIQRTSLGQIDVETKLPLRKLWYQLRADKPRRPNAHTEQCKRDGKERASAP